jgi:hypothetical protein
MDKSCLSDEQIVAATRNYVCVRPSTYENKEESAFLASLFKGRSGELENTVFALLAPDGKTPISRAGRGPEMALGRGNDAMASSLDTISQKHKVKDTKAPSTLPTAPNMRLAINVAACDNQALVICYAESAATLTRIENAITKLAWSESHLGQFHYVSSSKKEDLSNLEGVKIKEGLLIVEPNRFGTEAKVLAQHAVGDSSKTIDETLTAGRTAFDRTMGTNHRDHHMAGKKEKVYWETLIPVTDPGRGGRRR